MYAIIEACGRQYKVEEGETIYFDKLDVEEGKKVKFDKVVLISDKKTDIGTPYINGAVVEGKVISDVKGKKLRVFKYKPKKNIRKVRGHRQQYTKVEITKISTSAKKEKTAEVKKEKETKKESK